MGRTHVVTKKDIEKRLRQHFSATPLPEQEVIEGVVRIVAQEAGRQRAVRGSIFSPNFSELIMAQIRVTKGFVWVVQLAVIAFALLLTTQSGTVAGIYATFGAAAAILAGISVAGIAYGRDSALTELTCTCHFDYRQVVIARMISYGLGDFIALILLTVVGSSLLPVGFGSVVACAASSFFATGFACLLLLSFYRGEAVFSLCAGLSVVIAGLLSWFWHFYPNFLRTLTIDLWPFLVLCTGVGILLCGRFLLRTANSGLENIQAKTN